MNQSDCKESQITDEEYKRVIEQVVGLMKRRIDEITPERLKKEQVEHLLQAPETTVQLTVDVNFSSKILADALGRKLPQPPFEGETPYERGYREGYQQAQWDVED
jgi:hypothetical protein